MCYALLWFFLPETSGLNNVGFFSPWQAGWTPLHIAASAGRDEIVKALIAKGAHVNAVNQNGCTPLHYAASKNEQEVCLPMLLEVVLLLEEVYSYINISSSSPFLFLHIQIAVMLLDNGADPDATDHFESTPLHRAAAKGNLKMVQILLNYKASVNIQDSEGNTPL